MAEQTPTTTKDQAAFAKEQLAKDKEVRQRIVDETTEKTEQVKPTPTQEENDRARMGEDVVNKEDDGSGPEVELHVRSKPFGQNSQQSGQRKSEDKSEQDKQAYATRQQTPKPPSAS